MKPIDFYARRTHYVDHLAPVWNALDADRRGTFYVCEDLRVVHEAAKNRIPAVIGAPTEKNAIVVAAYGDLQRAYSANARRPIIFMEHGVGLTFNQPGYAGGIGMRRRVSLFLAPNEFIRARTARALPGVAQVVIGTPKLDIWKNEIATSPQAAPRNDKPVVCIAFHWDGSRIAPEAGNALRHYRNVLSELAGQDEFTLIGHGHPRIIDELEPIYEEAGIEVVRDFRDVMQRADLYVNDCSSTLYEFCVTGKPVILLNAPWFRSGVHFGLRFWEYADVGPQVDEPEELLPAILGMLEGPGRFKAEREKAVKDLYPHLGVSAATAARAIEDVVG